MPETFLNKAQLTGLSADARRTEILRARGIAELDARVAALEAGDTEWTSFTPTWTNYTRGNGTTFAIYRYRGKMIEGWVTETLGTTSSMGTDPIMNIPNGETLYSGFSSNGPQGIAHLLDFGVAAYVGALRMNGGGIRVAYTSGSSILTISSTAPFTWATSDEMRLQFMVPIL